MYLLRNESMESSEVDSVEYIHEISVNFKKIHVSTMSC